MILTIRWAVTFSLQRQLAAARLTEHIHHGSLTARTPPLPQASQGSPPPRTDAMASAAAVKVWAVLATLALLTVLQVSSSPTNIVDGQCSKTAKKCRHCFLVAIDKTDSTRCKLIWYYEVGKHSCRRNYHNIVCKPGAIEPLGLYKLCIRKCTGMGSYFLYRHVSPRWEIVINSTNKTN